jgi:hypothetical protein
VLVSAAPAGSGIRSAAMPAIATVAARGPGHAGCSCPTVATALPRSGHADAAVADGGIIPKTPSGVESRPARPRLLPAG